MQKAAAFFGGAVLGGVISAACGFDLFREDRALAQRDALQRSQEELQKTKVTLVKTRELLSQSEEKARDRNENAAGQIAPVAAKIGHANDKDERLRQLEEQLGKTRADADRQRTDTARLSNEAAAARHAFTTASLEARKWKEQVQAQILRFFSKERDAADAALVSQYLASSCSKDEKQILILELIKRNKEVLMSLPHEVPVSHGGPRSEETSAGLVGAAAREEAPDSSRAATPGDGKEPPSRGSQ